MTEECRQKIVELARCGYTDAAIADVVHYAPMYVKQIRLAAGIVKAKGGHKRFPEDLIKLRIRQGNYPQDIAAEIGCSVDLVWLYRRQMEKEYNDRTETFI